MIPLDVMLLPLQTLFVFTTALLFLVCSFFITRQYDYENFKKIFWALFLVGVAMLAILLALVHVALTGKWSLQHFSLADALLALIWMLTYALGIYAGSPSKDKKLKEPDHW